MAEKPEISFQFTVTTGCLCYGALHNIWHGSDTALQGFPMAQPKTSGTVRAQSLEFNVATENGEWHAYQLLDMRDRNVAAWFACHSSVEPRGEIGKILRVAGSPYENGTIFNSDQTAEEGVLVINRYDWGYYDSRSIEVIESENGEDAAITYDDYELANCVGLVDREMAKDAVTRWKGLRSCERGAEPGGVWMHVPGAEYMFGRFGFNGDRNKARSFLYFTSQTEFTQTTLAGIQHPLRRADHPDE